MYFGEHVDYIESLWFFRPKITVFMYMHNKLPSFFVVGAQKAGTSYLHNMLSEDPRIFLPRIKETHFFNDGKGEFYRGVDFYIKKYFNNAPNYTIKGEVDPEYLYFSKSAKRIAQAIPEAKLIFLFRKPAERAFSHYSMSYRRGIELLSFEEALTNECTRLSNSSIEKQSDFSYRDRGLYGKQVEVFLNYFSIKQMLFIDSLEFWNNTNIVMERIYNFIGVNYEKKNV